MRFHFTPGVARHFAQGLAALLTVGLLSGCRTSPPIQTTPKMPVVPTTPSGPSPTAAAVRYGRYTLVELAPDTAQQDLMQQVIDVTVPVTLTATVGDALRYVLLRSGYQLCESGGPFASIEALPLPAAHLHLGPLKLHDALQVLAGSVWKLEVNEAARLVCFAQPADAVSTSVQPDPGPAVTHASPAAVTPNSLATERQQ